MGGSNLVALPAKDPLFKDRVLVVDADTLIPKKSAERGNTIKLPCHQGARGTERSPENAIKIFLRLVAKAAPNDPLYQALRRFKVTNPTTDKVLSTFFADDSSNSDNRDASKGWWVTHWKKLHSWAVVDEWATYHASETAVFVQAFEAAAEKTARRITLK